MRNLVAGPATDLRNPRVRGVGGLNFHKAERSPGCEAPINPPEDMAARPQPQPHLHLPGLSPSGAMRMLPAVDPCLPGLEPGNPMDYNGLKYNGPAWQRELFPLPASDPPATPGAMANLLERAP